MSPAELKSRLHDWLAEYYPHIELPEGDSPLGCEKLLNYYDHMEIAMLQLKLHDRCPDYLLMIRRRRNLLRRLQGSALKKEQFRSLTAF